jgi:hypothetical protein
MTILSFVLESSPPTAPSPRCVKCSAVMTLIRVGLISDSVSVEVERLFACTCGARLGIGHPASLPLSRAVLACPRHPQRHV